jgi:hypothetical protein
MAESRAVREARLKAALRDNLRKRKSLERDRQVGSAGPEDDGSAPAKG